MFAKWDDILAIREVPETARGQCPSGGLPYAMAVYHYARTLALAAKAEGAAQRSAKGESQRLKGLAETSLALLRVRQCSWACRILGAQASAVHACARIYVALPVLQRVTTCSQLNFALPVGGRGQDSGRGAHCARASAR